MISNLFSLLGFTVEKPEVRVTIPPEIKAKLDRDKEKLIALYGKDAIDTAEMYNEQMPKEVMVRISEFNDFQCVQWGSRKSARLLNLCRNILDIEIFDETRPLSEGDRKHVLFLLMWMCWLVPIPIKNYLLMSNSDEVFREKIKSWMVDEFKVLTEREANLVIEGVFERDEVKKGNPVLDIFHDALKYESAQFGMKVKLDDMRTALGKNEVFRVKAEKDARNNSTPHWLFHLQDLMGLPIVNKAKAKEDNDYMGDDGIT